MRIPTTGTATASGPSRQAILRILSAPGILLNSFCKAPGPLAAAPPKLINPAANIVKSETVYAHGGISGTIWAVCAVPPPMKTLDEPVMTAASQTVLSPTRTAG
ncbi:hypothetical protein [Photorhabdus heterorhabditis]|uniref:hypothetical protein n=1 Tax=Photorhabdus heterorhabditis TaxID=880156 RepID=UPI0021D2F88B|nr:hypothetical protein [Photorhabdus heterorhabditis]